MAIDAQTPQSPGWWLKRLGSRIVAERNDEKTRDGECCPGLDTLRAYAEGRPKLPDVPGVDPLEAREWMRIARANWTGLVIDSTSERMHIDGFRFGGDDDTDADAKTSDKEANRIWQENSMDADADLVHYGALSQRRAFVLVEKDEETGRPVLTHETPRQMAVEYEPGSRRKLAAGLKLWFDDWTGQTRATLWLPESIYYFATPVHDPKFADLRRWDAFALPNATDGQAANELGQVPIGVFTNRRNRRPEGFAEHEDILSIQDRINLTLINLIAAMKYGAFRQRWAAGLEVDEDPITGKAIEPFQLDIKRLWTTDDNEVKFGEFSATDLGPYVKAVDSAVQDLAAISRTPPHYLIGAVVNVSGDALKAAETGLVSKVRDRQRNFGESWEHVMRLAFAILGDEERANEWTAETIWRDPEARSVAELADAAVKQASAGVPWRQRMLNMQFTPVEIDRMEVDRAADALLTPNPDLVTGQNVNVSTGQPPADPRTTIGRGAPNDNARPANAA